MHKKFNQPAPITWGELLRVQEQAMESAALTMRKLDQDRIVTGLLEDLLRRRPMPIDAEQSAA